MPSEDDIPSVDRGRLRWSTGADSLLGEGSFGRVYRGTWDGATVAIKVIRRPAPDERKTSEEQRAAEAAAMKQHRREIHRFRVVQNPNIIQCFGVFRDVSWHDLYIVTEYLEGGSLYDSLTRMRARRAVLDERSFLQVASQMAYGLNHVHSQRYTHGDMKPQNILLSDTFQFNRDRAGEYVASLAPSTKIKIADFGLSKRLEGAEQGAGLLSSSVGTGDFGTGPCGTYLYMSPEGYRGVSTLSDADAKAADVYAYGLILFELLTGLQSWSLEKVQNAMQLHLLVRDGHRPAWGERKSYINPAYIDLVERCWNHETQDRPTVPDIVDTLAELSRKRTERAAGTYASSISSIDERHSASPKLRPRPTPKSPGGLEGSPRREKDGQLVDPSSASHDDDHDSTGSVSTLDRRSTITHVESMKALTQSQEIWFAGLQQRNETASTSRESLPTHAAGTSEDLASAEADVLPQALPTKAANTELVVEPKPDHRSAVPEIDQSVVGGQQVVRVQTIMIEPPPAPELLFDSHGAGRASYGTGSTVNGVQPLPSQRKEAEVLDSFFNAAGFEANNESMRSGEGQTGDQYSALPPKMFSETYKPELPPHQHGLQHTLARNGRNVAGENPSTSMINGNGTTIPLNAGLMFDQLQSKRTRPTSMRSYRSPAHFDEGTLSEMMEKDYPVLEAPGERHLAVGHVQQPSEAGVLLPNEMGNNMQSENKSSHSYMVPLAGQTGDYRLGQSSIYVPPGGGHQAHRSSPEGSAPSFGVTPSLPGPSTACAHSKGLTGSNWPSPGLVYASDTVKNHLREHESATHLDSQDVYLALKSTDVRTNLLNSGQMPRVASELASHHDLGGTEMLLVVCDLLNDGNIRKDPEVARDLCTAIGNIARNEAVPIEEQAVVKVLRVALSTMFGYRQSFQDNVLLSVQVFAACNFALCNLFKVYNVVEDAGLRTRLAEWVAYSISQNVSQDGATRIRGPHLEALAYTATSAARNFMWINEDNVVAFTKGNPSGAAPVLSCLMSSMKYFDWMQCHSVVEASLSALAMVIHFPKQRIEFIRHNGFRTILNVLHAHSSHGKIASLIFSMIVVLLSGPGKSHEQEVRKELVTDGGYQELATFLDQAHRKMPNILERVEVLQKGFLALLSVARFCESLRLNLAEKAVTSISTTAQRLAVCLSNTGPNVKGATLETNCVKLGIILSDLICELGKEQSVTSIFRKEGLKKVLEALLAVSSTDNGLAQSCRSAIAIITD